MVCIEIAIIILLFTLTLLREIFLLDATNLITTSVYIHAYYLDIPSDVQSNDITTK